MLSVKAKSITITKLLTFYAVFLAIWSVWVLGLRPFVGNHYNEWIVASIGVVVKLLLWTAPAIFLIKLLKLIWWYP